MDDACTAVVDRRVVQYRVNYAAVHDACIHPPDHRDIVAFYNTISYLYTSITLLDIVHLYSTAGVTRAARWPERA